MHVARHSRRLPTADDESFDPFCLVISPEDATGGLRLKLNGAALSDSIRRFSQAGSPLSMVFGVRVIFPGELDDEILPDVSGRWMVEDDEVTFNPHLPLEPGLSYELRFDPALLAQAGPSVPLKLQFSLPLMPAPPHAEIEGIFPSESELPANLLRFYVRFSQPMQRGRAESEIELLELDGEPVADALYRAPVELWDRDMRTLTVLLDPGRLKRGVGPNRELGPPIKVGHAYSLVIGKDLVDLAGQPLGRAVIKRFRASEAVRERISLDNWSVTAPEDGTRNPVVLEFPRSLDWALLSNMIWVETRTGERIAGTVSIDQNERRWQLTPATPWKRGGYRVHVEAGLEDCCGNNMLAPFDQDIRQPHAAPDRPRSFSVVFGVG